MTTNNLPTPANKIVADFVDKISTIEPNFVEGIYLTGSLPMGDFYFNKSDIDFLVLCRNLPDAKTALLLKNIHKLIAKRFPKPDLSGIYLAFDSLKSGELKEIKTLNYHQGVMRYGTFDMAPIVLSELKANAITVFGQQAERLPIDVEKKELQDFLYDNINSYWTKWINKHSLIFSKKLLLLFFPKLTEWSILGVARQLCTLQTGKIVSKKEAGIYCLQQLPEKFHPIIKKAIEIRKDNRAYPFIQSYVIKPSVIRLTQTINCVNYIIKMFNKTYNESRQPILFLSPKN